MADQDYYELLGVNQNSDENEIKKAYRKLAMKYHPDKNKGDQGAEKKFKEISEAYEILKDPQKKQLMINMGTLLLNKAVWAEHKDLGISLLGLVIYLKSSLEVILVQIIGEQDAPQEEVTLGIICLFP